MGKITVFTSDGCLNCSKALAILATKTADVCVVSLTQSPKWNPLVFLLTKGRQTVPQVFFNSTLIGGLKELEELEEKGALDGMVRDCTESNDAPLELRIPQGSEFIEVIPKVVRDKWSHAMETELGPSIGGTPERPITGMMVIMDTPGTDMIVACSVGEASVPFPAGMVGPKGTESKGDKFYCQVAIENTETLFLDGPSSFPVALRKNYDHVQFGYSWYLGAPWRVRDIKGTIAVVEKQTGILNSSYRPIVEAFRDRMKKEFEEYFMDSATA